MSTRKQLGVGARKTIMARHQRMPTSKAGYTCAVEPTVVKQITCIEEESIYALVQCTNPCPLWGVRAGLCRLFLHRGIISAGSFYTLGSGSRLLYIYTVSGSFFAHEQAHRATHAINVLVCGHAGVCGCIGAAREAQVEFSF